MKQQTAVEWLFEQFFKVKWDSMKGNRPIIFEQAKEMEKEQITDSYIMGSYDMASKEFKPEQYYNETYNQK